MSKSDTTPTMPRGTEKSTGGKPVSGENQSPRPISQTICPVCAWTDAGMRLDTRCKDKPLQGNAESDVTDMNVARKSHTTTSLDMMRGSRDMWKRAAFRQMVIIIILCVTIIVLGLANV